MSLQTIANQINQGFADSCNMKIGKIINHPDGYKVKVISGQFLSNGRVSNFWYWKKVLKNGKLTKKEYCGYGW
jgi:hypothetical protein